MTALLRAKRAIEKQIGCRVYFLRSDGQIELHAREPQEYRDTEASTWLGTGETFIDAVADAEQTLAVRARDEADFDAGDAWLDRCVETELREAL
jgi:hypothetical protein